MALGLWHLVVLVAPAAAAVARRWFFRAVVAAGPLSVVALIAGWVTTEVGRQPWVVYEVMRTEEAVTGAGGIPVGYATLVVVYAALIVAVAWILRRLARVPLEIDDEPARESSSMLAELPLLFVLAGLAAYAVLAGADFGAGIWHMLPARPARRRGARAHPPIDVGRCGRPTTSG